MADQAEVYWAAVNAQGVPLQLGRTRRIATRGQTAALIARDKGCSFPGCDTAAGMDANGTTSSPGPRAG